MRSVMGLAINRCTCAGMHASSGIGWRIGATLSEVGLTLVLIAASAVLVSTISPAALAAEEAGEGADAPVGCAHLRFGQAGGGDTPHRACLLQLLEGSLDPLERAQAYHSLGAFQVANQEYRLAVRQRPGAPAARVAWGRLFLEAEQHADAKALFKEALELDPADSGTLTAIAELLAAQFDSRAGTVADEVLAIDGNSPGGQLVHAQLRLEVRDIDSARALLDEIIAQAPPTDVLLNAYSLHAAADLLSDEDGAAWIGRALALAPGYGDIYVTAAHYYEITIRYQEAVDMLTKAVAIDPENHRARAELGMNLMRVNRMDEARSHLETAHDLHPFNAGVVNTLRLLDSLDDFDEVRSETAIIRVHPDQSAVVAPYVKRMIDRAGQQMSSRYGFTLTRPAVIELYPHHADFAVRTHGLPGIAILGAAFGDVVVMNGPGAHPANDFDWINALWHEIAHIYTLNATNNRVARWFSEGVSVFEEWHHGPSARESVDLAVIEAYGEGKLLPIESLDEGFLRPTYENQIQVSYAQSGLVATYIDAEFNDGLKRVLHRYAAGDRTAAALTVGLGTSLEAINEGFDAYLDARIGAVAGDFPSYQSAIKSAVSALHEGHFGLAVSKAQAAIDMYPAYIGDGSPYLLLVDAATRLDRPAMVARTLGDYWQRGGRDLGALQTLADKSGDMGQIISIRRVLARAEPMISERHQILGDLLAADSQHAEALMEYRAVMSLAPHDVARAHLQIALTLTRMKRNEEARLSLLSALEIAPRYPEALQLLLEMSDE